VLLLFKSTGSFRVLGSFLFENAVVRIDVRMSSTEVQSAPNTALENCAAQIFVLELDVVVQSVPQQSYAKSKI
jgi:hypothetical protein